MTRAPVCWMVATVVGRVASHWMDMTVQVRGEVPMKQGYARQNDVDGAWLALGDQSCMNPLHPMLEVVPVALLRHLILSSTPPSACTHIIESTDDKVNT
jgi:hypothetical protein